MSSEELIAIYFISNNYILVIDNSHQHIQQLIIIIIIIVLIRLFLNMILLLRKLTVHHRLLTHSHLSPLSLTSAARHHLSSLSCMAERFFSDNLVYQNTNTYLLSFRFINHHTYSPPSDSEACHHYPSSDHHSP